MTFDLTPYRHFWTRVRHVHYEPIEDRTLASSAVDWPTVCTTFTATEHKILLHNCDSLVVYLIKLGLLRNIEYELLLWTIRRNYGVSFHRLLERKFELYEADITRLRRNNALLTAAHFGRSDMLSMLLNRRNWPSVVLEKAYVRAASAGCHDSMHQLLHALGHKVSEITHHLSIKSAACHTHINVLGRFSIHWEGDRAGSRSWYQKSLIDWPALAIAMYPGKKRFRLMEFIFHDPALRFNGALIDYPSLLTFVNHSRLSTVYRPFLVKLIACRISDTLAAFDVNYSDWFTFLVCTGSSVAVQIYLDEKNPSQAEVDAVLAYCLARGLPTAYDRLLSLTLRTC